MRKMMLHLNGRNYVIENDPWSARPGSQPGGEATVATCLRGAANHSWLRRSAVWGPEETMHAMDEEAMASSRKTDLATRGGNDGRFARKRSD